jgi:hypothetical protein
MIPIPDFSDPSGRLAIPKLSKNVFGLVTLVAMNVSYPDDRFELSFRMPLQPTKLLELAASSPTDIAIAISRAYRYLKPQWLDCNFSFAGPTRLLQTADDLLLLEEEEEYGSFDRTLVAYCMAYNVRSISHPIRYKTDELHSVIR